MLHVLIGIVNRLLKHCLDFVNDTLEDIPESVQLLKSRYYDRLLQLDARKERESDWNRQNMTELTHLRLRRAELKKIEKNLQQRCNNTINPLTDEQDLEEIVNEHHGINILIKELETEKKMNRIPNELKVELNETKKALNDKQKNGRCVWNRWIRSQIEQEALINNGINRGKAHGRELNGNDCKQLCGAREDAV
jgi:hypothetical protein